MTTLYMVTDGSYSDYSVKGIYSTEEKANHAVKFYQADNGITEIELDALPEHPDGMFWYEVGMLEDGTALECQIKDGSWCINDEWRPYGDDETVMFYMWARDDEHAVKIANERRTMLIATNQWTANWDKWIDRKP